MRTTKAGRLRLLGSFRLEMDSTEVKLGQARLEELIAFLALRPGTTVSRRQLAFQLWPDSTEKQAHTNVRNVLHKLKKSWPTLQGSIDVDRNGVTWRTDGEVAVDVEQFRALGTRAKQLDEPEAALNVNLEAAALYHGDLLPNCYADWAVSERERVRAEYAAVLERSVDLLVDRRRYREALVWARRLVVHDALREASHRRLIQIHCLLDDRAAALRAYHHCATLLEQELGVAPSNATQVLYAQVLQHAEPARGSDAGPQEIARPTLVGRHAEWQALRQAWRNAQSGRAQCVLIWGEAGIGKTRLAQELVDWARRQGHAWATSRAYAAQGAMTYTPIAEWLRSPQIAPRLETLDDLWRVELARVLPELLAARPDLPQPGALRESWQQQRFYHGITQALQAESTPLLLHLDDMQWTAQENLVLLQYLLHNAPRHPMLIVGTVRTEDALDNQPLAAFADALRHQGRLTELRLGPLSREETALLAEQIAGTSLSSVETQGLYEASEGHPLFLVETVQMGLTADVVAEADVTSVAGAATTTEGETAVDGITVPPKIYAVVAARLRQLSPEAQQAARAAAVIGRDFAYAILQAVVKLDERQLVDALDELWHRRIIREQSNETYDFSHDRIREVAYRETSRARRRLLHRSIAHALESANAQNPDTIVGELAAHFAAAGDSDQAFVYYRRAAQVAMGQYAVAQAAHLFDQARAHAPGDPVLGIDLLGEQNCAFRSTMNFARWRDNIDLQEACLRELAQADEQLRLKVLLDRSEYHYSTGDGEKAVSVGRQAVDVAKALGDETGLVRAYLNAAHGYWTHTRMDKASHYFRLAGDHARAGGDERTEALCLELQAQTGMFSGMPSDEILARLTRAYATATRHDDKVRLGSLQNKFGYYHVQMGLGEFEQAIHWYELALNAARTAHDMYREQTTLGNLGVLYTMQGDYRRAFALFEECYEFDRRTPTYWRHWTNFGYIGRLFVQIGQLDFARDILRQASEELESASNRHLQVFLRCDLGLAHHLAGEHDAALDELTHVHELILGHGDLRAEAVVNTRLGYVLEALGNVERAAQAYARGQLFHEQMGERYRALHAQAGLARLARRRGDDDAALAHATTIWETIAGHCTEATVSTARTLRTCYEIFAQVDAHRRDQVLAQALAQLKQRASGIDDPALLADFGTLDDHRFFLART